MAKSKYETIILPRFDEIKKWVSEGLTDREIIDRLGISRSTWYKHKSDFTDFSDAVEVCRRPKVEELEKTMFKLAQGYTIRLQKSMKVRDPGGGEHLEDYVEDVHVPPNFNALRFLLTNWSEEYANDPALMRQRKEEFEHKKKMDEDLNW